MNQKIKIAHIISEINLKKMGGPINFMKNLLFFINKNISENYLITYQDNKEERGFFDNLNIPIYSLLSDRKSTELNPLEIIQSLTKTLNQIKPDIVQTNNHWADFYGRKAAIRSKIPIIISREINMIPDETHQYKASKQRLTQKTDAIVCVSHAVKKYALEIDQVPLSKLKVIHVAIRLDNFDSKLAKDKDENSSNLSSLKTINQVTEFVFVARLEAQKAPLRMINAIASLLQQGYDCKLSIIGDGSLKEECSQQVKQLGLSKQIIFLGYQEKPWQLVKPESIFVMTSDFEGFGQTITEAMASYCLCIVPTLEPILEIAIDGEEAIFYQAGNQTDLEDKMKLALSLSSSEKLSILKKARAKVEQNFDAKIMANRYLNLYQELYQKYQAKNG